MDAIKKKNLSGASPLDISKELYVKLRHIASVLTLNLPAFDFHSCHNPSHSSFPMSSFSRIFKMDTISHTPHNKMITIVTMYKVIKRIQASRWSIGSPE